MVCRNTEQTAHGVRVDEKVGRGLTCLFVRIDLNLWFEGGFGHGCRGSFERRHDTRSQPFVHGEKMHL